MSTATSPSERLELVLLPSGNQAARSCTKQQRLFYFRYILGARGMSVATASKGMRALVILGRCVRAPFRVLVRARDLYVSRMAACAGGGGRGPVGLVAMPRCQSHGFYRSAGGGGGDDDDIQELIRAASRAGPPRAAGVGPRSQSVAVGRIDEDRPCEFGLDDDARMQALGPRSKSCAVGPTARTAARRVGLAAA